MSCPRCRGSHGPGPCPLRGTAIARVPSKTKRTTLGFTIRDVTLLHAAVTYWADQPENYEDAESETIAAMALLEWRLRQAASRLGYTLGDQP